jgi:PAS domain S-box-containing protein
MSLHLLVIDDSDDDATLLQRQFRKAGIEVTARRVDTADALAEALRRQRPDVIICDYNMPQLSAGEALEQITALDIDVPFILVSGQVGEEAATALMRAGAHDFVLKDRLARLVPAVQRELREADDRRQRRAAEDALRLSEQRFRLLAEHAQDVIFRYRRTPDPRFEYLSPAVEQLIGYHPDELYADADLLISLIEPEDRSRFEQSLRWSEPQALTVRWHRRSGGMIHLEQRAVAVRDNDGNVIAVEGILRDITERTHAEEERQRLEHRLRQNERLDSLGHLAGGVAHDFNNLLAVILGYCDVVAESFAPDDPGKADLEGIRKAAQRGASLTRQLLIFSRLEPSRPETIDLNHIIRETGELLERTLGADIRVVLDLAPDLRPVHADRSKMEQVLLNLIMNARAAMPSGGVLQLQTRDDNDRVVLCVSDNGRGMEPEVVRRAFEPFFTTRPKGQGTGLGLATAYGAVTDAGGTIDIDSMVGIGTTIRVELPATTDHVTLTDGTDDTPADGSGHSVLLVEDEDAVRHVLSRQLEQAGYRVHGFSSPAEALLAFTQDPRSFDVVLTDIVMPEMSGTQLASRLSAARPDVPIVFMSGYTTGPSPGGHELPADHVLLHKPFDRTTLLSTLYRSLHPAEQQSRRIGHVTTAP